MLHTNTQLPHCTMELCGRLVPGCYLVATTLGAVAQRSMWPREGSLAGADGWARYSTTIHNPHYKSILITTLVNDWKESQQCVGYFVCLSNNRPSVRVSCGANVIY